MAIKEHDVHDKFDYQEEERRKILKMLISPSSERKPKQTLDEFMIRAEQDQVVLRHLLVIVVVVVVI